MLSFVKLYPAGAVVLNFVGMDPLSFLTTAAGLALKMKQ